jgi:arabinose-5-phosphate isomerase
MRKGDEIPVASEKELMPEVLFEMTSKHIGCAAITSSAGELVGIITDGDLRRHISDDFLTKKAADVMTKNPIAIDGSMLAVEAVGLMNKKSITNLFVVENKKIVGVLHIHDCLKGKL